jgi:hypothetical protein
MEIVIVLMYVAAFICFCLAAFRVPFTRIDVGWLGLAIVALAMALSGGVPMILNHQGTGGLR